MFDVSLKTAAIVDRGSPAPPCSARSRGRRSSLTKRRSSLPVRGVALGPTQSRHRYGGGIAICCAIRDSCCRSRSSKALRKSSQASCGMRSRSPLRPASIRMMSRARLIRDASVRPGLLAAFGRDAAALGFGWGIVGCWDVGPEPSKGRWSDPLRMPPCGNEFANALQFVGMGLDSQLATRQDVPGGRARLLLLRQRLVGTALRPDPARPASDRTTRLGSAGRPRGLVATFEDAPARRHGVTTDPMRGRIWESRARSASSDVRRAIPNRPGPTRGRTGPIAQSSARAPTIAPIRRARKRSAGTYSGHARAPKRILARLTLRFEGFPESRRADSNR